MQYQKALPVPLRLRYLKTLTELKITFKTVAVVIRSMQLLIRSSSDKEKSYGVYDGNIHSFISKNKKCFSLSNAYVQGK